MDNSRKGGQQDDLLQMLIYSDNDTMINRYVSDFRINLVGGFKKDLHI